MERCFLANFTDAAWRSRAARHDKFRRRNFPTRSNYYRLICATAVRGADDSDVDRWRRTWEPELVRAATDDASWDWLAYISRGSSRRLRRRYRGLLASSASRWHFLYFFPLPQ